MSWTRTEVTPHPDAGTPWRVATPAVLVVAIAVIFYGDDMVQGFGQVWHKVQDWIDILGERMKGDGFTSPEEQESYLDDEIEIATANIEEAIRSEKDARQAGDTKRADNLQDFIQEQKARIKASKTLENVLLTAAVVADGAYFATRKKK